MQPDSDIIIEFINIGNIVKVTAICAKTGREVSIVGNPRATKSELKSLAVRKLNYVLEKEAGGSASIDKPGLIV